MTMMIHVKKAPATKIYGRNTISGKGNVEDIMIKCLIIRKDDVIPYSETIVIMTVFCGHILYMIWKSYVNLCADESEKVVLGNLIMKYYFPGERICSMLHDYCHILCYDGSKAQELNKYTNGNRNHGENS